MFTYVHSHTTDTWPAVPLGLVLVVGTTGLQDGLVNTSTSSNDTFTTEGGQTRLNAFLSPKTRSNARLFRYAFLPTTALLAEAMTFLAPEGSLTLDFLVSGLWEMTVA